jgi:hypothetical protein
MAAFVDGRLDLCLAGTQAHRGAKAGR